MIVYCNPLDQIGYAEFDYARKSRVKAFGNAINKQKYRFYMALTHHNHRSHQQLTNQMVSSDFFCQNRAQRRFLGGNGAL